MPTNGKRGRRPAHGEPVVDRALALLAAFDAEHRTLSLAELSRRCEMPPSSALRLANRLREWGALERDDAGRFCVGLRLLEVATLAPRGHGLRQVALPFMNDLAEVTHQHVQLAVRDGMQALLVERLSGHQAAPVDYRTDWEVELVAVIGRGGHRIRSEQALSHVAGYLVGQDLSERRVQALGKPPQFSLAKSFPAFGPTGPHLVTELAPDAAITCLLNDEVVQKASVADMIFGVPELVARLSAVCPLLPGDLIFTGTPAGVGNRRTPPRYLTKDDVLTSRIDGLGELLTRFR